MLSQTAHESTVWGVAHLPQNRDVFMTCGGNGSLELWKCARLQRLAPPMPCVPPPPRPNLLSAGTHAGSPPPERPLNPLARDTLALHAARTGTTTRRSVWRRTAMGMRRVSSAQ